MRLFLWGDPSCFMCGAFSLLAKKAGSVAWSRPPVHREKVHRTFSYPVHPPVTENSSCIFGIHYIPVNKSRSLPGISLGKPRIVVMRGFYLFRREAKLCY